MDGTELSGTLQLRPGQEPNTLVSNFRRLQPHGGCEATMWVEEDWGPDMVATSIQPAGGNAKEEQSASAATPHTALSEGDIGTAAPAARDSTTTAGESVSTKLFEDDCQARSSMPVKNTFIHFFEDEKPHEVSSQWRSAPPVLLTAPFLTKSVKARHQEAHFQGLCRPCAYFWRKEDGCRRGAACHFCHLCQSRHRRHRKAKDKMLSVQDPFAGFPGSPD